MITKAQAITIRRLAVSLMLKWSRDDDEHIAADKAHDELVKYLEGITEDDQQKAKDCNLATHH